MSKLVYLTIDDCPSEDFMLKVDFLSQNRIPAILFCTGSLMEKMKEDVVYAIKNGFIIGNHSYSHPRFADISVGKAFEEIRITDELIDLLYMKSGIKRPAKLFRFPYYSRPEHNPKLQDILKNLGYTQPFFDGVAYPWFNGLNTNYDVFWTFDFCEYAKSEQKVFERMEQVSLPVGGTLPNPHSAEVLVIHDHKDTTKNFLNILDKMIEKGFSFGMPSF